MRYAVQDFRDGRVGVGGKRCGKRAEDTECGFWQHDGFEIIACDQPDGVQMVGKRSFLEKKNCQACCQRLECDRNIVTLPARARLAGLFVVPLHVPWFPVGIKKILPIKAL